MVNQNKSGDKTVGHESTWTRRHGDMKTWGHEDMGT